jgi:hypothetical protein
MAGQATVVAELRPVEVRGPPSTTRITSRWCRDEWSPSHAADPRHELSVGIQPRCDVVSAHRRRAVPHCSDPLHPGDQLVPRRENALRGSADTDAWWGAGEDQVPRQPTPRWTKPRIKDRGQSLTCGRVS